MYNNQLSLCDEVKWNNRSGKVRFVGTLAGYHQPVVGVAFEKPVPGGMDGFVDDECLFICKPGHGLILNPDDLSKVTEVDERSSRYSTVPTFPKSFIPSESSHPSFRQMASRYDQNTDFIPEEKVAHAIGYGKMQRMKGNKDGSVLVDLNVEGIVEPLPYSLELSKLIARLKFESESVTGITANKQNWYISGEKTEDTMPLSAYHVKDGMKIIISRDNKHVITKPEITKGSEKNRSQELPEPIEGCWVCPKCTYAENTVRMTACELCKSKRVEPDNSKQKHHAPNQELHIKGWPCPDCTFMNDAIRLGCEVCSAERPEEYNIPPRAQPHAYDKVVHVDASYQTLLDLDNIPLIANTERINCSVCNKNIHSGKGVTLRNCLHQFCRDCLVTAIENSVSAEVYCPDVNYQCEGILEQREIRELLPADDYEIYLAKGLENVSGFKKFYCKTLNCENFCIVETGITTFACEVCNHNNCVTCDAIHDGETCDEYKKKHQERQSEQIQALIDGGEAMRCPNCSTLVHKRNSSDVLMCRMCRIYLCWATKGRRWGTRGIGDNSQGCQCGNPNKCAVNCRGCDEPQQLF